MSVKEPLRTPQIKTTISIDRRLWGEVKKVATERNINATNFVAVAVELLLTLVREGRIPDDLGYMLERGNPRLLSKLNVLIRGR